MADPYLTPSLPPSISPSSCLSVYLCSFLSLLSLSLFLFHSSNLSVSPSPPLTTVSLPFLSSPPLTSIYGIAAADRLSQSAVSHNSVQIKVFFRSLWKRRCLTQQLHTSSVGFVSFTKCIYIAFVLQPFSRACLF